MIVITTRDENVLIGDIKTGNLLDTRCITNETGIIFNDGTIIGFFWLGDNKFKLNVIEKGTCFISEKDGAVYVGKLVKHYVIGEISDRRW